MHRATEHPAKFMFLYRLKIFFLRVLGYEKPLRVAILKYLSLKYKQFKPNYETILLESCIEAKKLGYDEVSVLELGVAGGNGLLSLEKYKKKIQKLYSVKINIYGFDSGEGLPVINDKLNLPFLWKSGDYKIDKKKLEKTGMTFAQSYKIVKKFCKGNKIFSNGDDNSIIKINLDYNNLVDRKLNIINIKKILKLKYKIPEKFICSSAIHTFFGYKLKKNKMHNAIHDCLNVLKALKKTKFIL
jgi:hypothetical protein